MSSTKIYIGTSGWNYDHWDKVFYPEDLPKTKRFQYYAKNFNTIEINATFYRSFSESTYKKWYEQAPRGFRYILKVPRFISHRKHLNEVKKDSIKRFVHNAKILKSKLGAVLLQIGPNTSPNLDELQELLELFGNVNVAVEFRDDEWFETDSPEYSLKFHVTGKVAYIRLHGKDDWYKYDYPNSELGRISKRINDIKKGKVEEIFIFFNNDYKGFAPKNALKLKDFI